jgi:hypothetical protein
MFHYANFPIINILLKNCMKFLLNKKIFFNVHDRLNLHQWNSQ